MSVSSIPTHLRLFDSGGWVLPWIVANEAGFFAQESTSVEPPEPLSQEGFETTYRWMLEFDPYYYCWH